MSGHGSIHPAIHTYGLCKAFNVLPGAGGIDDQDIRTILELSFIENQVNRMQKAEIDKMNKRKRRG